MEKPLHPDFRNIRAKDEQEFYKLAADYFYSNRSEYRTGYHIFFFLKIDGFFQIVSCQYFAQKTEYRTFEDDLKSNHFRIIIESAPEGLLLYFIHSFLKASELFISTRMALHYYFNQELKDHIEKGTPYNYERERSLEEFFKGIFLKAIQSGSVEKPKKRLAS